MIRRKATDIMKHICDTLIAQNKGEDTPPTPPKKKVVSFQELDDYIDILCDSDPDEMEEIGELFSPF